MRASSLGVLVSLPTSAGAFQARFCARGLCALAFPTRIPGPPGGQSSPSRRTNPSAGVSGDAATTLPELPRWLDLTRQALEHALGGRAPAVLPPLNLDSGTDFQRRVWRALQRIPPGETRSYSEIAQQIGHPSAARAVGQACGANPIPVLIPCHRVLARDGSLGGFSAGLEWKRWLLERERP